MYLMLLRRLLRLLEMATDILLDSATPGLFFCRFLCFDPATQRPSDPATQVYIYYQYLTYLEIS
jgi:hypothetical protein